MAPGKWSTKSQGKQMKKKDDFAINWVYDDHIKNSTKYFTKCGESQTSIMPQKLLCRSLFYQTKAE